MRQFGISFHTDTLLSFAVTFTTIDLSRVPNLQDVAFRLTSLSVGWITRVFKTTIPRHQGLRKISIRIRHLAYFDLDTIKQSEDYEQWLDFDRLLVQFWESRSTCPTVVWTTWKRERQNMRGFAECLLPEITRRGMIDFVK